MTPRIARHARTPYIPSILAVALLVAGPGALEGQVLFDDPAEDRSESYPFAQPRTGHRFQQLYDGTWFGTSSVFIESITFFEDEEYPTRFATGDFTIRISETPTAIASPSLMFDENLGPRIATVYSGVLSGIVMDRYTFTMPAPFLFDPTYNLLFDIMVTDVTDRSTTYTAWDAFNFFPDIRFEDGVPLPPNHDVAVVVSHDDPTVGYGFGSDMKALVTEFGVRPAAVRVVPEPFTFILLATGLLALAGASAVRLRRT